MRWWDIRSPCWDLRDPQVFQGHTSRIAVLATPTACDLLHTTLLFTSSGATSLRPLLKQRTQASFKTQTWPFPERQSQALQAKLDALPLAAGSTPWLWLPPCSPRPIRLVLILSVGVHPPTTWWATWGWESCSVVRGGPPEVLCYKCLWNVK